MSSRPENHNFEGYHVYQTEIIYIFSGGGGGWGIFKLRVTWQGLGPNQE